jgi:hypothetical protein
LTASGGSRIIELVKTLTILLVVAATIPAQAGVGAVEGSAYTTGQLPRIVDPRPALSGWSFAEGKPYLFPVPRRAPAFTLDEFIGASPTSGDKAFAAELARAGFVVGRHRVWDALGSRRPAKVVVFAFLFRTAAGAADGVRVILAPIAGAPVAKLGNEAWKLGGRSGAVYLWRRGNLVVYAGVDCRSVCTSPPAGPARTYADELDARAKRAA